MSGSKGGDGGGDIVWPWANSVNDDDFVPWPISKSLGPRAVSELIGKKCRVVKITDRVTGDRDPGRVTILLDEHGHILEIYKEPDCPRQ